MKQKRFNDRLKNLEVGNVVVIYYDYTDRQKPFECIITKKGRKYFTVNCGYNDYKISLDTFTGEYNTRLFPGNIVEYEKYKNTLSLRRNLLKLIEKEINNLDIEEIKQIEAIIKSE